MALTVCDLKVLICEDEYMIAFDMAQQLGLQGVQISAIVSRLSDADVLVNSPDFDANAAILDLRLYNEWVFPIVPALAARGTKVVFCSGYARHDLPADLAHVPFFNKPVVVEHVVEALRAPSA